MVAKIFISSLSQRTTFICVSIDFFLCIFFPLSFSLSFHLLQYVLCIAYRTSRVTLSCWHASTRICRRWYALLLVQMSFSMFKVLCVSAWLSFILSLCAILSDSALSTSTTEIVAAATTTTNENFACGYAMLVCAFYSYIHVCLCFC